MTSPLDRLPDPVLQLDAQRRIVDANEAATRLAGRDRDELVGTPLAKAFAPKGLDGEALLVEGWHSSARLRSVTIIPEQEVTVATAGGDRKVRVTGRYERNGDGSVTGAVLVLRPERRRSANEPTGSEVVSTVSHELRSPLTSVKGYTSLLLNRWDRLKDDQKKMMLEQVHHDADRVTRLITELLDISRLETGRLVLRRQLVDVAQLADHVVEKLSVTYTDLDCTVTFPEDF